MIHHLLGCGINVLNIQPMTSLVQLQDGTQTKKLSLETTAASVISKFEMMWAIFIHGGVSFEPFMDLYLKRWIHSSVFFFIYTCRSATFMHHLFIFPFSIGIK